MNDDTKTGVLIGLFAPVGFVSLVLVLIPFGAWTAFVGMKLWDWFAVPLLHAPNLDFWGFWGLSLLLSWILTRFTSSADHYDHKVSDTLAKTVGGAIATALWMLIILGLATFIRGHL